MKKCKIENCGKLQRYSKGWCSAHYTRWRRHGNPKGGGRKYATPEEAFEARTMPEPNTGCLLWIGAMSSAGYGQLRINDVAIYTHRYSWERANGPIPKGLHIDHICHTPQCVEPAHLRAVTRSQNLSNRKGPDIRNKSGYRNVSWRDDIKKWQVVVQETYIGHYSDLEEAAEVAEKKRNEFFREYAGRG